MVRNEYHWDCSKSCRKPARWVGHALRAEVGEGSRAVIPSAAKRVGKAPARIESDHPVPPFRLFMRLAVSPNPGTSRLSTGQAMLCRAALLLLVAMLAVAVVVPTAVAQSASDEVHVTPRKPPDAPKDPLNGIDPALKTHTKPIKVDVDLVLVSVTITDPMNRLVTGLEKDNFQLYEDKQ